MALSLNALRDLSMVVPSECPPGCEQTWLAEFLKALANVYACQCKLTPEADAAPLARLFCGFVAQWNDMREIALARGVALDPHQRDAVTVAEWRAMLMDAAAFNQLLAQHDA